LKAFLSYHISYQIVDIKRQNRLKVGADKSKLKVKMQSVYQMMMSGKDFLFAGNCTVVSYEACKHGGGVSLTHFQLTVTCKQ